MYLECLSHLKKSNLPSQDALGQQREVTKDAMGNFFLLKGRSSTMGCHRWLCMSCILKWGWCLCMFVLFVSSFQTHCWRLGRIWTSGETLFREGRRHDEGDSTLLRVSTDGFVTFYESLVWSYKLLSDYKYVLVLLLRPSPNVDAVSHAILMDRNLLHSDWLCSFFSFQFLLILVLANHECDVMWQTEQHCRARHDRCLMKWEKLMRGRFDRTGWLESF